MEFGILGPLWVRRGGTPVEVRRGIPRTLLVVLISRAPETVQADALADALWGDDQPRNPANALQLQISYLRKTLGSDDDGPALIVTRGGGYALDCTHDQIDARRFETLVRESDHHGVAGTVPDMEAAMAALDMALSLWRGEALADARDVAFAWGEVTRLTELFWEAKERRLDLLLALGRHAEAVSELASLVAEQPLRERFREQLALALYRSGRQADALRAVESARAALREELGVALGPGLQKLEFKILKHDGALDWSAPAASGSPTPALPDPVAGQDRRQPLLPAPLWPIIGREVETKRVRELLGRHRMITLTGPPGAGKSRLAVEVGHAESGNGPVWFLDLGPILSDDLVAPTVAGALGIPTTPGDDAAWAVARAVAREKALFILDTCERVVAGAAELSSCILRNAPGARILATSRRPIGITGEIAWPVPPLSAAPPTATANELRSYPATELFCARAEAAHPDFSVNDSNAHEVAAICLALDGLPLAIELAAARTDVLTPASIRARLQNRFDILVDGGRDVAPRQQTLRSALDWSFELLDGDQCRFFARLGVFHGSFDLDAAAAVAGFGLVDPLALLVALVRQSMVVALGDDRYRLLDTLRVYALDVLGPEDCVTRARHAAHFVALAEKAEMHVRQEEQLLWLNRLRADLANFRAAAEWSFSAGGSEAGARLAGALAWFWTLDGMLSEAIRHLERAVEIESLPPLVRAKALWGLALLAASLGQLHRARAAGAESAALGRSAGDDVAIGCGLNALAVAEWALGHHALAAAAHDEAITLFERAGDVWGVAICTVLRARTAIDEGDPRAGAMADEGLAVARRSGDRHVIGIAFEQMARVRLAEGHIKTVLAMAEESLAAQELIGYTEGTIAALHMLGRAQALAGRLVAAESTHLRALRLAERIGHAAAVCEAFEGLAQVRRAGGRHADALRLLVVAAAERERSGLPLRASEAFNVGELRRSVEEQNESAADVVTAAERVRPRELAAELLG